MFRLHLEILRHHGRGRVLALGALRLLLHYGRQSPLLAARIGLWRSLRRLQSLGKHRQDVIPRMPLLESSIASKSVSDFLIRRLSEALDVEGPHLAARVRECKFQRVFYSIGMKY